MATDRRIQLLWALEQYLSQKDYSYFFRDSAKNLGKLLYTDLPKFTTNSAERLKAWNKFELGAGHRTVDDKGNPISLKSWIAIAIKFNIPSVPYDRSTHRLSVINFPTSPQILKQGVTLGSNAFLDISNQLAKVPKQIRDEEHCLRAASAAPITRSAGLATLFDHLKEACTEYEKLYGEKVATRKSWQCAQLLLSMANDSAVSDALLINVFKSFATDHTNTGRYADARFDSHNTSLKTILVAKIRENTAINAELKSAFPRRRARTISSGAIASGAGAGVLPMSQPSKSSKSGLLALLKNLAEHTSEDTDASDSRRPAILNWNAGAAASATVGEPPL